MEKRNSIYNKRQQEQRKRAKLEQESIDINTLTAYKLLILEQNWKHTEIKSLIKRTCDKNPQVMANPDIYRSLKASILFVNNNWDVFKDYLPSDDRYVRERNKRIIFSGPLKNDDDNPLGLEVRKSGTIKGLFKGRSKRRDLSGLEYGDMEFQPQTNDLCPESEPGTEFTFTDFWDSSFIEF